MVLNLPNRGAPSEPKDRSDEFVANWEEKVEDFDQTELALDLLHGIYSSGYQHPSEVQSLAIRPICMHRNVVVCASEASGKTSALVMGILNNIDVQLKETQALVLSPMGMLACHQLCQTHQSLQIAHERALRLPQVRTIVELTSAWIFGSRDEGCGYAPLRCL